ncbi:MAG: transglutaminase family protein, partial [Verrucomicrobiota bacterium]
HEDVFYLAWKERRLPSNVTPEKSHLKDPLERERIARIFQQGLGAVVGYALPLKRALGPEGLNWVSGPWFLRDGETLWLIPGDSAMGLRLPLDSIPWVAEKEFPWVWPANPTQPLPPLPAESPYRSPGAAGGQRFVAGAAAPVAPGMGPGQRAQSAGAGEEAWRRQVAGAPGVSRRPAAQQSAPWIIRSALCVEPRGGRLHVFMPPVASTEDYLDLVAGVEAAAAGMGVPVIVEGETPPADPRLNKLAVTPDPGVIEVNLHPSASWDELVERTTVLYEEARQTRLGTEKFLLDGRHTGTGGGNHIILGGATPQDSPLLRRPDLLRSLLAYWQNHPSLSWLFSGLFIGPTSQAPR